MEQSRHQLFRICSAWHGAGLCDWRRCGGKERIFGCFYAKGIRQCGSGNRDLCYYFVGINGNVAGDAAFVVLPPVAGVIFLGMGRHPLLGVFCGYASVAAGFCANIMLGMSDSLAYGLQKRRPV